MNGQPYRKKPVVIEAKQFESLDIWRATTSQPWHQVICDRQDIAAIVNVLHIHTLEGWHEVTPGDWIIQGVKGEFYPCKPDIFDMTYERVLPPEPIAPPRAAHDRPVG